MRDPEWMADLIGRVPVLAIDVAAAAKAGDVAALSYRRAMDEWRTEATLALVEADLQDSTLPPEEGRVDTRQPKGAGPSGKSLPELVSFFCSGCLFLDQNAGDSKQRDDVLRSIMIKECHAVVAEINRAFCANFLSGHELERQPSFLGRCGLSCRANPICEVLLRRHDLYHLAYPNLIFDHEHSREAPKSKPRSVGDF